MREILEPLFGNCKYQASCICNTKDSFEFVNNKIFYVFDEGEDSQTPVKIVNENDEYQLTVSNDKQQIITLIKTDKCLIENNLSKCDCIISSAETVFFIEIKSCGAGTRNIRRRKAVSQLSSTLTYIKSKGTDLSKLKIVALICLKSSEPRITQASKKTAAVAFKETFGAYLEEGNSISFD